MAILLILLAVWIASSAGQTILSRFRTLRKHALERFVYAAALGLGLAAYGVFALGMAGLLSRGPVAIWWSVLALAGLPGMRIQALDLRGWSARWGRGASQDTSKSVRVIDRICVAALLVMAAIAVFACFRPPGPIEWDVLAYHLADPKVFLSQHRITILPTEHHSNFPLTMEMLFAVGLLFNGYALANLFHLATAVLTVLAMIAFGRRIFAVTAGLLAGVLFATTPLILWEASVAYIDVASALYTTLAIFAAMIALYPSEEVFSESLPQVETDRTVRMREWLLLAGAMMGFGLGTKYLAIIPLALVALLLLARRMPWRIVAGYVGIAIVIASPWYLKNIVWMRNPVYPFYYKLFPHSRYWSLDRERSYRSEQAGFGYPHSLNHPREAMLNLLETPWHLLIFDQKEGAARYYNQGEFNFCAFIGGLYAGLCLALPLMRRHPAIVKDLGWLVLAQLVIWFFLTQIGRYLLQILPLAALLSGYAAWRLISSSARLSPNMSYVFQGLIGMLFGGQVMFVLWSLCALPTGGAEASKLETETGLLPTAVSIPETISLVTDSVDRSELMKKQLDIYAEEQWINRNTRPGEGVILYEDTRGYYLDRPYLWGNGEHSSYIPYSGMSSGADLTRWMEMRNYHYAIINLNWSPMNRHQVPISEENAAILLQHWYVDEANRPGTWRRLVGDAIKRGLWTVVDTAHGCVLLRIGEAGVTVKSIGSGRQG